MVVQVLHPIWNLLHIPAKILLLSTSKMQTPSAVPTPGSMETCLIARGTCHQKLQGESMARHAG
eukprot:988826-Ditylum_brightwellii.AAC.1